MLAPCLALAAAAALAGSPYDRGPFPPAGATNPIGSAPHPGTAPTDFNGPEARAVAFEYQAKAKALQSEMIALQASDGGKLTRPHRAYLRDKADALIRAYRRDLRLAAAAAPQR